LARPRDDARAGPIDLNGPAHCERRKFRLVEAENEPPGGGGKRSDITIWRAAWSRSDEPDERVTLKRLAAPEAPMVKAKPTTPAAPLARAAAG
jgi:hypothetical protein